MRIGFDASFAINDASGVGRYSFNLIKNLLEIDNQNDYLLFINYYRNRLEKEKKINELVSNNKKVKIITNHLFGKIKDKIWFNPLISPINLYFGKLDLYHATCFQAFPKKIGDIKSVVTIHDLTYLVDKNYHQNLSNYYKKITINAVKKANTIITDSNATKNDLIKYFKTDSSKIQTIYLGIDNKFKPASSKEILEFKNKYTNGSEYILSVGTLEPRKNFPKLIEAYQQLPVAIQNQYKLLVIGKSGWGEINQITNSQIIFTGFLSDEELITAYSGANVFVYPSLYEGFGFPPLEAMACGTPVITSNVSSLPEVVGNAAELINPYIVSEITKAIEKILINKDFANTLIKKCFAQSDKFTWSKTAQQTLEIYNRLDLN
ncbi:MAG: group 1 glycosyl transferase [uncultured bacterium]|nr:MAG: group 1 glycosyl transferase [uncultured bacterium]